MEYKLIQDYKSINKNMFGKYESLRLKGLLVIIMFWGHMFNHPERLVDGVQWKTLFEVKGIPIEVILCPLFHCAVPIFFFIGGYGFWIMNNNGLKKEYLKKQIIKLYTKYWIVFCLFIPIFILLGKIKFSFYEFIMNFTGISSTYCGEWWFLSTYILIIILWSGIYYLNEKLKISKNNNWSIYIGIISFILACIGYIINYLLKKNGYNISNVVWHQIYYLLIKQTMFISGVLIAKHNTFIKINTFIKKFNKYIYISIITMLIMFCIVFPYKFEYIPESFSYPIYVPILVFVFCKIDAIFPFRNVFELIGKNSTYMWFVHSLFLYKIMQKIIYFPKYSIICWIILVIISLLTSYGLNKLEKIIIIKYNEIFRGRTIR